jgi:hypothetical protein
MLCSHMTIVRQGPRRVDALLEEISPAGAVVSLPRPLRARAAVRIDCGTCTLRGKVVGCTKWIGGYLAEVEFHPDEPWVPANFKPDRLFNPRSLMCGHPGCSSECVSSSCISPSPTTAATPPNPRA